MIPGMFPGFITGAGLTTLAVVDQVQAVGGSLTLPTVQDGDLVIVQTTAIDGDTQLCTFSAITGYTTIIDTVSAATQRVWVSLHYKIVTAADSGAVLTGGAAHPGAESATRTAYKAAIVVRGDTKISLVTAGGASGEFSTGNPSAQTVTISGEVAPLIVIGSYSTAGLGQTVGTRTFTISGVGAKDGEYQEALKANYDVWLAWKSFNVDGVSLATPVVIDMGAAGASALQSCYLACS